jgi:hypothetical protein
LAEARWLEHLIKIKAYQRLPEKEVTLPIGKAPSLDMGQMRKAEQARLVADLLDHLFTHNREPLWLVLEEADAFAPQPMGELTRVLGEVDRNSTARPSLRVSADFDYTVGRPSSTRTC